mmetsp:Transcript_56837/g.158299  ORF Transcript_56837/g.158299 Transcript_56837/m.158299 type:complete len:299 (-) Transcript_56837:149-1045(-)
MEEAPRVAREQLVHRRVRVQDHFFDQVAPPIKKHVEAQVEVIVIVIGPRQPRRQGARGVNPHGVHVLNADLLRRPEVGEHVLWHRAEAQSATAKLDACGRPDDDILRPIRLRGNRVHKRGRVLGEDPHARGRRRRMPRDIHGVFAFRCERVNHVWRERKLERQPRVSQIVRGGLADPEVAYPRRAEHRVQVPEAQCWPAGPREDAATVGEGWQHVGPVTLTFVGELAAASARASNGPQLHHDHPQILLETIETELQAQRRQSQRQVYIKDPPLVETELSPIETTHLLNDCEGLVDAHA